MIFWPAAISKAPRGEATAGGGGCNCPKAQRQACEQALVAHSRQTLREHSSTSVSGRANEPWLRTPGRAWPSSSPRVVRSSRLAASGRARQGQRLRGRRLRGRRLVSINDSDIHHTKAAVGAVAAAAIGDPAVYCSVAALQQHGDPHGHLLSRRPGRLLLGGRPPAGPSRRRHGGHHSRHVQGFLTGFLSKNRCYTATFCSENLEGLSFVRPAGLLAL